MQSSQFVRRVLAAAAITAIPASAFAASPWISEDAPRAYSAVKYQKNQVTPGLVAGGQGASVAGGGSDVFWVRPSVRDRQFIDFGTNPNLPAPTPNTNPADLPEWNDPAVWGGPYPDGGNTAVFRPDLTETTNDENFGSSIVMNVNVNLGGIRWEAPGEDIYRADANGSFSTSITANASTGLTLTAQGTSFESLGGQPALSSTFLSQTINVPVIGSGSVTVTGPSTTGLATGNTFTGGLFVTGGRLGLWALPASTVNLLGQGTVDDSNLGNGTVVLNNGTVGFVDIRSAPQAITISKNIGIAAGLNGFEGLTQTTFTGALTDAGPGAAASTLIMGKINFASTLNLQGVSTYSGTIQTISGATNITAGGRLTNISVIEVSGGGGTGNVTPLTVGQAGLAPLDRINDAADIRLNGARVQFTAGNAATTENVGKFTLTAGLNTIAAISGTSGAMTVHANSLDRQNRSGVFFQGRGLGLGGATGGTIAFDNGTALLVGSGGAVGTTNRSIIPFALGVTGSAAGSETSAGSGSATLVSYGANGVAPLDLNTEYVRGFGGVGTGTAALAGPGSNVLLTDATTNTVASGGVTINALVLGSSTGVANANFAPTVSGGTLTVTSGAVLVNSSASVAPAVGTIISAPLAFGANEAIFLLDNPNAGPGQVLATGNLGPTFTGDITGTNGLSKIGPGTMFLIGAKNFSGPVNMHSGRLVIGENVLPNVAGPLGNSNDPIIMNSPSMNVVGGSPNQTRFLNENPPSAPVEIGRQLVWQGKGSVGGIIGGFGTAANGSPITTFSGGVALNTPTYAVLLVNGDVRFTAPITGTGVMGDITQAYGGTVTFGASSPAWTGGYQINGGLSVNGAGVVRVNANTALGTGVVGTSGNTVISSTVAGGVSLPNQFYLDAAGTAPIGLDGRINFAGGIDFEGNGFYDDVNAPVLPATEGDILAGFAIGSNTNVEFSGVLKNGSFGIFNQTMRVGQAGGGSLAVVSGSGGTVTLSNNANQLNDRVFIGAAGFGTVATGTQSANGIPGKSGGTLRLTANGALGDAGVQIQYEGSMLSFAGVSTPDNHVFFRPGTGVGGLGTVYAESGNNVSGGNLAMLETNGIAAAGVVTTVNTVGVALGATLRINGELADYSGTGKGINSGTLVVDDANTQVFTKLGAGTLILRRMADVNVFGDLTDGTTVFAARNTASTLAGADIRGGKVAIQVGGTNNDPAKVSGTRSLTLAAGAQLDLSNQALVVDYDSANPSPRAALELLVRSGRAGGAWNGPGINSSAAAAGPANKFAVGIAESTETSFSGTYLGFGIDTDTVLFRYVLTGDANLSGNVNIQDFAKLASGFNQPNGRWTTGDFNYDGVVNINDFALLASNFGQTAADLPRGAAVPEPASLGLIGLALTGLAARRRRA